MEYVLGATVLERNGDCLVRIGENARKSVAYLGYATDDPQGIDPFGTGFWIAHKGCGYLVTARHVTKNLGADPFVIRVNERHGDGKNISIDNAEWHYHPCGEVVDVAVLELSPPRW